MARTTGSLKALGLALAVVLGGASCAPDPSPPERIVLVVIDTLRRDHVSAYAGGSLTPHIDSLAARGMRFSGVYSAFHQTTMSMASLFTGLTPSLETGDPGRPLPWNGRTWCGLRRFAAETGEDACVPAALETLGERMKRAGYTTLGVTSNRLLFRPAGYDQGFDTWREVGLGRSKPRDRDERDRAAQARVGARVNEAVAAVLDGRPDDRFFLYVHYMDAHDYGLHRVPYAEGVGRADDAVGTLLELLGERGLVAGTTFVVTSDHGERLAERHPLPTGPSHTGNPSFDYLLWLPLIVAPAPPGETDGWLRSQDLAGLLGRLAGIDDPAPDATLEPDEQLLSEMHWRTYRRGRWKSTFHRRSGEQALFDLESDPAETRDVSDQNLAILEAHRARIEEVSRALGAPEARPSRLTEEDRARLRALGYAE